VRVARRIGHVADTPHPAHEWNIPSARRVSHERTGSVEHEVIMAIRTFYSEFAVRPPLCPEHRAYLHMFSRTRRMRRDPQKVELLLDPLRIAVGLPVGVDGASYVGGGEYSGGFGDASVVDQNQPPGNPSMHEYVGQDPIGEAERQKRLSVYFRVAHEARMSGNAQPDL
jgi:hypothetical protein